MWWGGGEKGPGELGQDQEASSSAAEAAQLEEEDEITPPLEIEADDDDDSLASSPIHLSTPTSSDLADLKHLQEQFSMQEDLLGQLKGVLRSNEAKLHFKEKEVEVSFDHNCL